MSLLRISDLHFTWSGPELLEGIDLEIERGQRIGLLGRNGVGKSTLMKIIAGEIRPDHGTVLFDPDLKIARLEQEVPAGGEEKVAEIVREGLRHAHIDSDPMHHATLEPWEAKQQVESVLSRMGLDGDAKFRVLSSGMKRRVLLAKALARKPDLLLLDEPTNHLDIEAITWLEKFLKGFDAAIVFVTHDRVFLQSLANRIVEIDRGRIFDWACDYATFLKRKAAVLEAEEKQNALFDKRLAQEERWIRQGIKARRTRNEGRVRALKKMREEKQAQRKSIGNVHMQAVEAEKSGQLIVECEGAAFAYGDHLVIKELTTLITRGEKIGIVGPNGAGKTTLLKLLLGEHEPTGGTVRKGKRLEVIYFDQLREQLDEEETVADNVGEGNEQIVVNGRSKHILGYLQDFLFTPERARQKVKFLSGGERNRLLLAKLFKRPSNVMVLDEPTNDLDMETLELLEELVSDYAGTMLLVSHDRAFLNQVVSSTLAFEPDKTVKAYDGGYDDYLRQSEKLVEKSSDNSSKSAGTRPKSKAKPGVQKARLSYKEKRDLDSLPSEIEKMELEQAQIHDDMSDPEYYKRDPSEIARSKSKLDELEMKLADMYRKWEDLEARS